MYETKQLTLIASLVRSVAAAGKSLRLYPPTSPIPLDAVRTALAQLDDLLATEPCLKLNVVRDGLTAGTQPVAENVPAAAELSEQLRDHDVAEIELRRGLDERQLASFLVSLNSPPDEVRALGGLGAVLTADRVGSIRVGKVNLAVSAMPGPGDDEVDEFLRELALDPARLSTWVSAAAQSDSSTFADGLAELSDAAAAAGGSALATSLAQAFQGLDTFGRDALLGLAMEGRDRDGVVGDALARLPAGQVVDALCGGTYGANVLSLSTAVARLPLGEQLDEVLDQVRSHYLKEGHTDAELGFFDRMVGLRASGDHERALADADPSLGTVGSATVDDGELDASRIEIRTALAAGSRRTVQTLLTLLDQQQDYALYCRTLERLAALTRRLIERGELALADRVLMELDNRSTSTDRPWADLGDRIKKAIAAATSPEAMQALLARVAGSDDPDEAARRILRHGGDSAEQALVASALEGADPTRLDAAGKLLGGRFTDCLAAAAAHAPAAQVATLVKTLAASGDARAATAVDNLTRAADSAIRKEAAKGLAGGGSLGTRYLRTLLGDRDATVAMAAARALGATPSPHTASVLLQRLEELDIDGDDFELGAEVLRSLAKVGGRDAVLTLKRLARRKALIKRGHFSQVQKLARELIDQALGASASGRGADEGKAS